MRIFEQQAMAIGRMFTIAANFTDPDAYFVGGGVTDAGVEFRTWFVERVRTATSCVPSRPRSPRSPSFPISTWRVPTVPPWPPCGRSVPRPFTIEQARRMASRGPLDRRSAQGPGVPGLRDVHAKHVLLAFEPILPPVVDLVEAPGAGIARVNPQHGRRKARTGERVHTVGEEIASGTGPPVVRVDVQRVDLAGRRVASLVGPAHDDEAHDRAVLRRSDEAGAGQRRRPSRRSRHIAARSSSVNVSRCASGIRPPR